MLSVFKSVFQSLKNYAVKTPNGVLAMAAVGVCSLVAVIVLVLSVSNTVAVKSSDPAAHQSKPTVSTAASNAQAASASAKSTIPAAPGTSVATSKSTTPKTASSPLGNASPNQPVTAKADYNLNQGLYFDQAYGAGTLNLCWQTYPFDNTLAWTTSSPSNDYVIANDEACGALGTLINIYQTAVASTPTAAVDSAGSKVQLAANAQNVVLRKGADGEGELLTESICTANSLSCGRW